jgi:hypothetical protein
MRVLMKTLLAPSLKRCLCKMLASRTKAFGYRSKLLAEARRIVERRDANLKRAPQSTLNTTVCVEDLAAAYTVKGSITVQEKLLTTTAF